MTVPSIGSFDDFVGPGATFTYTFEAHLLDDLTLTRTGVSPALLEDVLTTDDFVAALDTKVVTLDVPLITGEQLRVSRQPRNRQGYVPTRKPFLPTRLEHAWDRLVMLMQKLKEGTDRSLQVQVNSALTPDAAPAVVFQSVTGRTLLASATGVTTLGVDAAVAVLYDRLDIEFHVGFSGGLLITDVNPGFNIELDTGVSLMLQGSVWISRDDSTFVEIATGLIGCRIGDSGMSNSIAADLPLFADGTISVHMQAGVRHAQWEACLIDQEAVSPMIYTSGSCELFTQVDTPVRVNFLDLEAPFPSGGASTLGGASYIRIWGVHTS